MALTDLEHAALSGELFQPRSNSPTRSESTSSPLNTDDELASDLDDDNESDHKDGFVSRRHGMMAGNSAGRDGESTRALIEPEKGARTGIKGVLNDKKAHTAHTRNEAMEGARELRMRMENTAITIPGRQSHKTIHGAGAEEGEGEEEWRKRRIMEFELSKKGLKEVGKNGFVSAVEKAGWVLVLIYEPDIPRCQDLLSSMLELSTTLSSPSANLTTPITLLRARATTLSFSLLPSSTSTSTAHSAHRTSHRNHDEDDDEEEEEEEQGEADPDVLPTLLAYKDGELERKWIRVDWDIGDGDLETFLRSEGILPETGFDDRIRR